MLYKKLFPNLKGKWKHINLDDCSIDPDFDEPSYYKSNPCLQPGWCDEWIQKIHKYLNCNYSYGGYLENREHLWKGHYMQPGCHWHVGVDYNVPVYTLVYMPYDAHLISHEYDPSHNGGWGGKLVVESNGMYYCYAHMDEMIIQSKYKAGDLMGRVANYPENGNWFPHLHVQCVSIRPEGGSDLRLTLMGDGYYSKYPTMSQDFPMPI